MRELRVGRGYRNRNVGARDPKPFQMETGEKIVHHAPNALGRRFDRTLEIQRRASRHALGHGSDPSRKAHANACGPASLFGTARACAGSPSPACAAEPKQATRKASSALSE